MLLVPVAEQLEHDEKQPLTPQPHTMHRNIAHYTICNVWLHHELMSGLKRLSDFISSQVVIKLTTVNEIIEEAYLYNSFCARVEGKNSVQAF